jgi:hypothetical protein
VVGGIDLDREMPMLLPPDLRDWVRRLYHR